MVVGRKRTEVAEEEEVWLIRAVGVLVLREGENRAESRGTTWRRDDSAPDFTCDFRRPC